MSYKDKDQRKNYDKKYRTAHRDQIKDRDKKYYITHRDQIRERNEKWRLDHLDQVRNNVKKYLIKNPIKYANALAYGVENRRKTRLLALEKYGGRCVCCEETEPLFLCFDHINGGGAKDRKKFKTSHIWCTYLIKEHPTDIQILCYNCNMAKEVYGHCPHEDYR